MSYHKYAAAYVANVSPDDARDYLAGVGLPVEHALFAAGETEDADENLLPIGFGDPDNDDVYCVDSDNGQVLYLGREDLSTTYVSASPRLFDACLRVFEAEIDASEDDPEDLSERLRLRLMEIDPTAFQEDPGFWGNILFDVANGDYSVRG